MNPLFSSSFFLLLSYHLRSIVLTFFWHFLTFFQKNFKLSKQYQICHKMNILLSNIYHCSQMYIFWHLKKKFKFSKTCQICHKMKVLLSNVHHCSQMYIIAFKCTFLTFFEKTLHFRKHVKFATKWTFCSQMYIIAVKCTFFDNSKYETSRAAKPRIVHYQHTVWQGKMVT